MTARGIRNHNPGNIEHNPRTPWQGLADPPVEPEGRFCRFTAPVWGIRAIARTLITYQDKRRAKDGSRIDTIQEVIDRWAPSFENNSAAYAAHVRKRVGVQRGQTIDVHDYLTCRELVLAIIRHENGVMPYTDAQIDKGLALAGIEAPRKSLQQSRTVRGEQIAAASTIASAVASLGPVKSALNELQWAGFEWAGIALAAVTLIGIGIVIYARWDDARKLAR